jgi:adenylate cyclase
LRPIGLGNRAAGETPAVAKSPSKAIAEVERLLEQGDLLLAFDRASEHLRRHPDAEILKHRGVLALARAGATERAARLFEEWGLDRSSEGHVLALEARLAKDRGLKLGGEERKRALGEAAAIYRRIYEAKPDYYPAINWASLTFLAGDRNEARRVSEIVLADPKVANADGYWALATRVEANLLLDRRDRAAADISEAAARPDAGAGARSSTRRQLRLILAEMGIGAAEVSAFLAPLAPPPTLHVVDDSAVGGAGTYAGRAAVRRARDRIQAFLAELRPGAIFTALRGPGEVLFAEEALAFGAELNIVLPTAESAEGEWSASGASWARRFRSCCRKARRIVSVAEDSTADESGLSDYAARVAMGLTLLRAQHLDGDAVQVVLDGGQIAGQAIQSWRESGRCQTMLSLKEHAATASGVSRAEERHCSALIFGDLPGFSKMPEKYLPIFWDQVMGAIGDVLGASKDAVALKNTWGDAIHCVIPDVRRAAEICLAMQRRLQAIDGHALGREGAPTMRIGAHYGPVFEGWDPVLAHRTFYGRALSRAARIEPITPPGTVYVTEAFAAILLLESRGEFTCTYVGQVPLAKGFGTFRMYDLAAVAVER